MLLQLSRRALALSVLCSIGSSGLSAPPGQSAFYTRPDIHGDMVVFTAEGDLWLGSLSTGDAKRITSDAGLETAAHFSPDGTMLAFTAQYDRGNDVYVMPVSGGSPKRLTYDPVNTSVLGWTPDGKNVLFRSARVDPTGTLHQIFSVSLDGGLAKKLAVPAGEFAAMRPDGKEMAYVPGSAEWMNWFRYKGGEADDIWITDLTGKNFKKLTDNPGIDTTPAWLGNKIVFASEQGTGLANLCTIDPDSRKVSQLTHFDDMPVRYPTSDGKRVVFQKGASIWIYDPASGAKQLEFSLNSDRIHAREHPIAVGTTFREAALGPTGKRIVIEAQGQLVSVAAENGDSRVIEADSSGRAMHPAWSPDGKQIAYISDKGGEEQIYLGDAMGGLPKKLTSGLTGEHFSLAWAPDGKHLAVGDREMRIQVVDATSGEVKLADQSDRGSSYDFVNADYTFSPDGKWLAYSHNEWNWQKGIHLYELTTGKSVMVSDATVNSYSPTFDPSGKYLYYLQDREISPSVSPIVGTLGIDVASTRVTGIALAKTTPSPFAPKNDEEGPKPEVKETKTEGLPVVTIDLDGLAQRTFDVPADPAHYQAVNAIAGKLLLTNLAGPQLVEASAAGVTMISFDIDTKKASILSDGVTWFDISNDRTKLLIGKGHSLQVVDATGVADIGATGAVNLAGVSVNVQPVAMWREAFEEAWRVARDFFYDPKMHGVDWPAVRKKYEAALPLVGDRSDLTRVIGDMISELNVGHAYVSGASGFTVTRQPMGFLGVDLALDPSGKAYRITKIYGGDPFDFDNRSPLLEPGLNVHVGDYILEIGGQPVRADQDPQALLVGTQGHTTTLKVNTKPAGDGARVIRVVPKASETLMRYEDWVEGRRKYVSDVSGGQLGYVHMSDMEAAGYRGFVKGYFAATEKPGMVFDDRYNGGGFVASNVLTLLSAKPLGFFKPRYGLSWTREAWAPMGRVAVLTNEWAFSDGEYFAEMVKEMHVGPLIGTRTGGGEVGSGSGYELVDGGQVWIPNYGAFIPSGKWIVEGTGVTPDIVVEQDPVLLMQGKDPQLDKAIQVLMDMLKAHPYVRPTPPPFPVKVGHGG